MAKKRILWVDIVKIFSLIYIVMEHFIQSMQKSGYIPYNDFWQWIDTICAWIMVQLFFFCSGYLYQKQCKVTNFVTWGQQALKKLYYLGVPYFVFSLLTIGMKMVLSDEVNNPIEQGVSHLLFVEPIPPYWFLYILFILFVITLPIRGQKSHIIWLALSGVLYLIYIYVPMPYIPAEVCRYELWFVLGMSVAYSDWVNAIPKWLRWPLLLFIPSSVLIYLSEWTSGWVILFMGLWAGLLILLWTRQVGARLQNYERVYSLLPGISKYIMPIFLMQTIFAAGFRIMLIKAGIETAAVHIIGGAIVTFVGPSIAAVLYWKVRDRIRKSIKEGSSSSGMRK